MGDSNGVEIGSVVRLKSGGPAMTVVELYMKEGVYKTDCAYFDGPHGIHRSHCVERIPVAALELCEEWPEATDANTE
jgi:uncharacterized protein YodC (DUF2158 family)